MSMSHPKQRLFSIELPFNRYSGFPYLWLQLLMAVDITNLRQDVIVTTTLLKRWNKLTWLGSKSPANKRSWSTLLCPPLLACFSSFITFSSDRWNFSWIC